MPLIARDQKKGFPGQEEGGIVFSAFLLLYVLSQDANDVDDVFSLRLFVLLA